MTRRIGAAALVALCVGALAGGSALAAGEEIVVQSERIRIGDPSATPASWATTWIDPSVATTNSSQLVLYPTCLKLVNYDEDADEPVAEAATALPSVSANGRTYTFTVGSGHRFSDGEVVTALSFKRAIERATSPSMPNNSAARSLMGDVVGAADFFAGTASSIAGVQVVGDSLTVELVAPRADFVSRLAMSFFCATHSTAPAGLSAAPLPAAGPYYIDPASLVTHNEGAVLVADELVLRRNPHYGGTRTQNLGTIRWRHLGSSGDVDYVADPPAFYTPPSGGPPVEYSPPSGLELITAATTGVEMLFLDTTDPPFDDRDVRQAVAHAIDRTALAASTSYAPSLAATDAFLSPLIPGGVSSHGLYPLGGDRDRAEDLLAGAAPALTLCYPSPSRDDASASVEEQLEAVGFVVTRQGYPIGTYFSTVVPDPEASGCDALMHTLSPSYPDAAAFLPAIFDGAPRGASNYFGFDDGAINAAIDAALGETDEAERIVAWAELDDDLAGLAPVVAIGFRGRRDFVSDRIGCTSLSRARFGGFALNRLCIEVSEEVAAGGMVSTGGDATPESPLQTSVTAPADGTVTITQGISNASEQPSFRLLDQQLDISAPPGTVEDPLVLRFEIDAQTLADAGLAVDDVVVYRNGDPIGDCLAPGDTAADPDPCVASRTTDAEEDGVIVVRTSAASRWNFGGGRARGPFEPVNAQPTVNVVNAGRTVPVKFSLGGDYGLDVLADGYPVSVGGQCNGPSDTVETTTAGASGLQYDVASNTYQYNWKTAASWKGQCRTLVLRFDDGQELRASFRFT